MAAARAYVWIVLCALGVCFARIPITVPSVASDCCSESACCCGQSSEMSCCDADAESVGRVRIAPPCSCRHTPSLFAAVVDTRPFEPKIATRVVDGVGRRTQPWQGLEPRSMHPEPDAPVPRKDS